MSILGLVAVSAAEGSSISTERRAKSSSTGCAPPGTRRVPLLDCEATVRGSAQASRARRDYHNLWQKLPQSASRKSHIVAVF